VLEHLLAGGETQRALERALQAAANADRHASFQLASSLYRRALELKPPPHDGQRIRALLGQALINLGLGREGANELVAAAALLAAEAPDDPEVVRLRCAAGERLLLGGHWDEGIALVRETMATVGVPQAKTAGSALARGLLLMPAAAWQKRRWRARSGADQAPASIAAKDALRLDVVWSAGLAIAWLDPMRAIELHVRHAVLAHASGDRGHIARSKSVEAIVLAMRGGSSRWQRAIEAQESAQMLADACGDPDVQGLVALHWGLLYFFMGRWRDALRLCGQAIELGYTKGLSALPEMLLAQWTCLTCQVYLGEIEDGRSRLPDCLMAVEARDEQLSISCMRLGWVNFVYVCDDDIDGALAELEKGIAPYKDSAFNSAHYLHLISKVNAELYRRSPEAAWQTIEGAWRGLVASRQLGMTTVHCELYEVRGRAALARAASVGDGRRNPEVLREVQACVKALSASSMECAQGFASVLLAGVASLQQRRSEAVEHLERAVMVFSRLEMNMHAACCRLRLSSWLDEPRAHELSAAADAWFASQRVRQPSRIAEVLLGIDDALLAVAGPTADPASSTRLHP
jgi:tetratricopeptide (TPR) repeat protein